MKVLIVGITGFVGKILRQYLDSQGFNVFGTSHKYIKDEKISVLNVGDTISSELLNINFNTIIYLAHTHDIDSSHILINWYKSIFFSFAPIAKKQIYVSSYSANKYAVSNYGTTKYAIEQFFINNNGYAISPGLIIGNGGIYGRISKFAIKSPIIIIPVNNKKNLLPIIDIEKISFVINELIVHAYSHKNYNIFSEMITLESLVRRIIKNKKKIIFKISANFILKVMKSIEFLNIKLPVTSDSLSGFIANQNYSEESNLIEFITKGRCDAE